jgi:hypothetical protein
LGAPPKLLAEATPADRDHGSGPWNVITFDLST